MFSAHCAKTERHGLLFIDGWQTHGFLRTNDVITGVWAGAFALMVGADLVMLYVPTVPIRVGVWVTILAIFGAYRFTEWYPQRKGTKP